MTDPEPPRPMTELSPDQHPVTPPTELVEQWLAHAVSLKSPSETGTYVATQAARWGADQELEACISLMLEKGWMNQSFADNLRAARRPKPPSLKEQALAALQVFGPSGDLTPDEIDALRRALESLPD